MTTLDPVVKRAKEVSELFTNNIVCLQEAANMAIYECSFFDPESFVALLDREVAGRIHQIVSEFPRLDEPPSNCPSKDQLSNGADSEMIKEMLTLARAHAEFRLTRYFQLESSEQRESKNL